MAFPFHLVVTIEISDAKQLPINIMLVRNKSFNNRSPSPSSSNESESRRTLSSKKLRFELKNLQKSMNDILRKAEQTGNKLNSIEKMIDTQSFSRTKPSYDTDSSNGARYIYYHKEKLASGRPKPSSSKRTPARSRSAARGKGTQH